jgi:hypothetical protein
MNADAVIAATRLLRAKRIKAAVRHEKILAWRWDAIHVLVD